MVTPQLEKQFAERGVQLIQPVVGAHALNLEIIRGRKGEIEVVLGDGPWSQKGTRSQKGLMGLS
jgi:hypothetical protein